MCKLDKGRGVATVDKTKCLDSMHSIISDRTKFEPVIENAIKFTFRVEAHINYVLRKLKFVGSVTTDLYNSLYVSCSALGFLYGLLKIHKPDFKNLFQFRPIFASYDSPFSKISKYLTKVLAPLTFNECTVENSSVFHFCC